MAHPGEIEHLGVPHPRPFPTLPFGATGCRLRPAHRDDAAQVADLLQVHGHPLAEQAEQLLRSGQTGRLLQQPNGSEQKLSALAEALLHNQLTQAYAGMSSILVGERDAGGLVAALVAAPPVHEITTWLQQDHDPNRVLMAALTVARIDALIVNQHAPADTEEQLLNTCVELYRTSDYAVLYGHTATAVAFPQAYRTARFKLLEPKQTITLEPLLDLPLLLEAKPNTQLFARWLANSVV